MAAKFENMRIDDHSQDLLKLNLKIDGLIGGIHFLEKQFQKAEERERKAEERERKAEERRQLMIKQMEVQSNLTTSIQDLVGKIDELENMLREQSNFTNPAQQNNSITGIINDIAGGGE